MNDESNTNVTSLDNSLDEENGFDIKNNNNNFITSNMYNFSNNRNNNNNNYNANNNDNDDDNANIIIPFMSSTTTTTNNIQENDITLENVDSNNIHFNANSYFYVILH